MMMNKKIFISNSHFLICLANKQIKTKLGLEVLHQEVMGLTFFSIILYRDTTMVVFNTS